MLHVQSMYSDQSYNKMSYLEANFYVMASSKRHKSIIIKAPNRANAPVCLHY